MKKIGELGKDLSIFQKKLQKNLIRAQEETAEQMKKDVIEKLGFSSGRYVNSIQKGKTECKEDCIRTEVYTDLLSNKDQEGNQYLVGRMIENGTGIYKIEPRIAHTPTYDKSGGQYWFVPADQPDRPIGKTILIDGVEFYIAKAQKPKPHWKPVLEEDIELYKENIRKAIKEAL